MPRRLGQHFLKDKRALQKIAVALEISPHDTIVEIGPGRGELTSFLLKANPKKIIAIEKDPELVSSIKYQISSKRVEIVEGDALKILPLLNTRYLIRDTRYKLTGNIPYYITGHLLRKISELEKKPKLVVLTIQKEVAERIAAEPPKMNLLAASVRFWGTPKIVGFISKKSFRPPPKVDSAIIKIIPNKDQLSRGEAEKYYKFIRILFKQPRKTVLNNLREGLKLPQKEMEKRLQKLNILPGLRPANLSMSDINKLSAILSDKRV
ncbi:MAG: 16S rRNA (adenine(1518)-N(6)/adenine(1519)-N(6))-dimethyltransferase RsmA [bacterium]|nr:16S rRNA (adenine(1518)-N(6)/adenine(1519)-N(6))-dimethyltransferase RsmA [bacterium]